MMVTVSFGSCSRHGPGGSLGSGYREPAVRPSRGDRDLEGARAHGDSDWWRVGLPAAACAFRPIRCCDHTALSDGGNHGQAMSVLGRAKGVVPMVANVGWPTTRSGAA